MSALNIMKLCIGHVASLLDLHESFFYLKLNSNRVELYCWDPNHGAFIHSLQIQFIWGFNLYTVCISTG